MPQAPADLVAALEAARDLLAGDALPPWPTQDDDLAALLTARERLERRFLLAVVGEFSSGKSYLLNALLGKTRLDEQGRVAGLLATDINPSTATITELEYAVLESARARYPSGRQERIPIDRLARFIAVGRDDEPGALHDATADDLTARSLDAAGPSFVSVGVNSPFLARGFIVADTPGLASLNPAHRRATLGYLPRADAVLYLIDTQQPFSDGDAAFLGVVGRHVSTIFIVQTKIDLWRMRESDGRMAWESARARIVERAARYAPSAEVYAVSARDFAAGALGGDAAAVAGSGIPELLAGIDRSLELRAQAARAARALGVLREVAAATGARLRRETALLASSVSQLRAERARAEGELLERERLLARERDEVARAGAERQNWIVEQGTSLQAEAVRALASALDVADIERIRDRNRLHGLVDAALAPVWSRFADALAGHVARALERIGKSRPELRVADVAALRLGGEPGTGAWSRDVRAGIVSTIVLGAIGGPAVSFVVGVARAFSAHRLGTYMKRELGGDLQAAAFPAFERDIAAFVNDLGTRVCGIYADLAAAVERERGVLRDSTIGPIERALANASEPAALRDAGARLASALERLRSLEARLASLAGWAAGGQPAGTPWPERAAEVAEDTAFDSGAYDRGLRAERYRVVILGALRRGKSSLINALAGTRVLHDDASSEALFPIHVRYGERERAYSLETGGAWSEIDFVDAAAHAARSPVLLLVPWDLPPQLVLVHAPAFDSGSAQAEDIALAAAGAASEIVGLFSRQLSDRELAVYARVAELRVPLSLAHTIADNESAAERRNVVELAGRYVRDRGVAVGRIFTISALDYLEAVQRSRAPAAWNELGALRETLRAHAEEHVVRLERRARAQKGLAHSPQQSSRPRLHSALERLFGRG